MKIIILGSGQVGTSLAKNLCLEHHVTIIDKNPKQLFRLQNQYEIHGVIGMASHPDILKKSGAETADMIIAVTSSDEVNIIACQIAHILFNIPTKIARVRSRELLKYPQIFYSKNKFINTIINPEQLVIQRIIRQIEHPGTINILDFAKGNLKLASIRVTPFCKLIGSRIKELYQSLYKRDIAIIALIRNKNVFLAEDNLLIEVHDELYFFTRTKDINNITQILLNKEQEYHRIIIAGAGNIGSGLAKELEINYNVKVLDHNKSHCENAARLLNRAVVLNGDVSDIDLLFNENIDETDLFCSVTNDDETNIMSAIIAKRLGVNHSIALVNSSTYVHYLIERSPDIDLAISPQQITKGKILTFLRKGDMVNVYPLPRCTAEAIELIIHADKNHSNIVGCAIENIKFPFTTIVMGILRRENVIFLPTKNTIIQENDHLFLFVGNKSNIAEIENLF